MRLQSFGPLHLAIVACVPLVGWGLAAWGRRRPGAARGIRLALATAIGVNELVFYRYSAARGWLAPPHGLPLDLCDVVLWLTVYTLVKPRAWALDAIYYLGLAGSGMAVLTPDVGEPFPSYPAVKFFLAHGGVVASILFLVWTGALRPRRGSWWRVLLGVNAYAAVVGVVDGLFGTNYMYLRAKPESSTLLDLFGPWPWYLLGAEGIALCLFWLLHLPVRRVAGRTSSQA
ncbi:YwaF family protein [Anaeromyxobacter oryzisoli]|uniref:YwaF family protein n=1 Tax=Anaeromyxobacter oryzisoli TaxID=2925408 RepID=UPI001F562E87|nr:TIGR02206 family membrane protein [Anaeromyxobacter sp. SG63]